MGIHQCEQTGTTAATSTAVSPSNDSFPTIVVAGAGIVGLVLALALKEHAGITVELYEQARDFQDGVGAGIGLYPNGMRVLRDISPGLLTRIQTCGYPYLFRRWERHDGTEVVYSEESVLGRKEDRELGQENTPEEDSLQPLGIRRWKLQKILFEAVQKAGIPIYFSKKVTSIENNNNNNKKTNDTTNGNSTSSAGITLHFADGTHKVADMVLAADGAKSPIRDAVARHLTKLTYTGTTCLYGTASTARDARGICFPSSDTTKCHGCFYPIGPDEQCFQFHMPTKNLNSKQEGGWGTLLSEDVGKAECRELAERLKLDGWNEKYLQPLYHVDKAIKVPLVILKPPLPHFMFGRIVLVGDAAHLPVPYLGQGAQQGLEDAGTLALLFKEAMLVLAQEKGGMLVGTPRGKMETSFLNRMDALLRIYDRLRVPRTAAMVQRAQGMGDMQQKRAENARYNQAKEELIRRDVFFHETIPTILPGVSYDYRKEVMKALLSEEEEEGHPCLVPVPEEASLC